MTIGTFTKYYHNSSLPFAFKKGKTDTHRQLKTTWYYLKSNFPPHFVPFLSACTLLAFISHFTVLHLLSMPSSLSQFNTFSRVRHHFYNFLSLSFFFLSNFPPPKPSLPSPSPLLSHILSCQGHKPLKEKKKKTSHEYYESCFFSLSVLLFPPSFSQRYLRADFPHACQGWTALGTSR